MAAAGLHLAVEYLGIGLALDLQDADEATLGARQGMIDEDVVAGRRP
ncbi:MAG: hypothetical protein M5U33_00805 [Pseudorhodoplanes sp.]|nr:hypothetical protein [Pseudorhodoplanes sp.]